MPLNSVVEYVRSNLDNLTITGTTSVANLKADSVPPIVDDMATQPLVFVWGGRLNEKRQTMAGGRNSTIDTTSGFRDMEWQIDIYVKYAMDNSDPNVKNIFALIIDNIMEKLRGLTIPAQITDSQTTWPSTIMEIGEEMTMEYGDIYSTADQRLWIFQAHITTKVRELIQQ